MRRTAARRLSYATRAGTPPKWTNADVPIEKADLVLPLVDPGEVAARVHQPHQEEPRFAPRSGKVDEYLEEVDLGKVARPIRERHKDLAPPPSPFGHRLFHEHDADVVPFGHKQPDSARFSFVTRHANWIVRSRAGREGLAPAAALKTDPCDTQAATRRPCVRMADTTPTRMRRGDWLGAPNARVVADGTPPTRLSDKDAGRAATRTGVATRDAVRPNGGSRRGDTRIV